MLLQMITCGLSDREIAERIHRSPHTVKHQIERLRDRLELRNRIELAAWAGAMGYYVCPATRAAASSMRASARR